MQPAKTNREAAGATAGSANADREESLPGGWETQVHSVRSSKQVSTAREHSKWQTPASLQQTASDWSMKLNNA